MTKTPTQKEPAAAKTRGAREDYPAKATLGDKTGTETYTKSTGKNKDAKAAK